MENLTQDRKDGILIDFIKWSGGRHPSNCSWEFEVQSYLDNCLYGEDNRDSIIICEWFREMCNY
jgi:hypothetical protein